jgi:hypothetical protein
MFDGAVFSGSALGGENGTDGTWQHTAADGVVTIGEADWIVCRINGILLGDLGGPATWNGVSGYQFLVSVQDFAPDGEPHLGYPALQTITASRYAHPTRWEDGVVAIDSIAARVEIPTTLQATVGGALGQTAQLTFQRFRILDTVKCTYRGVSSTQYALQRCTGEVIGSPQVGAGDTVDVNWMKLRARTAKFGAGQVTVSVDLLVTPLRGDFYHFAVGDTAGQVLYETQGYLVSGDILVEQLQ